MTAAKQTCWHQECVSCAMDVSHSEGARYTESSLHRIRRWMVAGDWFGASGAAVCDRRSGASASRRMGNQYPIHPRSYAKRNRDGCAFVRFQLRFAERATEVGVAHQNRTRG